MILEGTVAVWNAARCRIRLNIVANRYTAGSVGLGQGRIGTIQSSVCCLPGTGLWGNASQRVAPGGPRVVGCGNAGNRNNVESGISTSVWFPKRDRDALCLAAENRANQVGRVTHITAQQPRARHAIDTPRSPEPVADNEQRQG